LLGTIWPGQTRLQQGVAADEHVGRPSAFLWRSQLNAGTLGGRGDQVVAQELVLDRYRLAEIVRADGNSTTYRASDTKTGETVGVIVVSVPPEPRHLFRAFRIGSGLSHPGLIKYRERFETGAYAGVVVDLVDGQSLFSASGTTPAPQPLGISQARAFLAFCDSVEYLHSQNLVHSNLKPNCVLMASPGTPKIIDIGHCEELSAEKPFWHANFHGTPLYSSPEHQGRRLTFESDYFSVGILFFEHLTGANPFRAFHIGEIFARIRTADVPRLELQAAAIPRALQESVDNLLSLQLPTRRAGWMRLRAFLAEQAKQHTNRLA
jgi:eukaryotic-like serine/threonine-protein kinase